MATLVLGGIGTLIGGPVGGAIGSMLGRAVDGALFAPPPREGPRLDELRVQTSSYGTPIPAIWGRARVAGTVIWASDLHEHREKSGGGKGRPAQIDYRYSVSLAVALSSRPLSAIRRVWAEGQLFVGADGRPASPVTLRLHQGDEAQGVDPLIAAAVGADACPAYRGIAYVVLEDMDLSPFGNRVPSLTFEVEGEGAAPTLATPFADRLGASGSGPAVDGLVLAQPSLADYAELVAPFAPLDGVGSRWQVGDDGVAPLQLGEPAGAVERRIAGSPQRPREVAVEIYEPARDYQAARTSAPVVGGEGAAVRIALPVAMAVGAARALAEGEAARRAAATPVESWKQGFAALGIPPATAVRLSDGSIRRVRERNIEGDGVKLTLEGEPLRPLPELAADAGAAWAAPDLSVGETHVAMVRVPAGLGVGAGAEAPRLLVAAAGSGAGWRQGLASLTSASGALPVPLGPIAAAAVVGEVVALQPPATSLGWDDVSAIEVRLAGEHMQLSGADDAALLGGANLIACDGELVQFGIATPLGGRRWRLSRLLRERFATCADQPGAGVMLLDDPALLALPLGEGPGVASAASIITIARWNAASMERAVGEGGAAIRAPLAPVHLRAMIRDDGALSLRWTARSRSGWGWEADPLLAGTWRATLTAADGAAQTYDGDMAEWNLPADSVASLRARGGATLRVQQLVAGSASPAVERRVIF